MKKLPLKAYYRPQEVAEFFDIAESTLYQKIHDGKIKAIYPGDGRSMRISLEEVERMKRPVD